MNNTHAFVRQKTIDQAIQHYIRSTVSDLAQQLFSNEIAPHTGMVLFGPKKLVNLLKQLTSRTFILINQSHFGTGTSRLICR